MSEFWKIELLGGLRVLGAERVITRFRTQKTALLLGYLALHLRAHPREALSELLWPDADASLGRQSLSTALSSLRRQLEPPGFPAGAVLQTERLTIGLNPAAVSTDVAELERLLAGGETAPVPAQRMALLSQAIGLYRGDLLAGYYEDWILSERERLAEQFNRAIRALIGHHEQQGDLGGALEYARRAVAADPLREESHLELIRLHGIAGELTQAVRQYRKLERLLARELEVAPSPAARALIQNLQEKAVGHATVSSAPAPERSTGDRAATANPSRTTRHAARALPAQGPPEGTVTFMAVGCGATQALRAVGAHGGSGAVHHDYRHIVRQQAELHHGFLVAEDEGEILLAYSQVRDALSSVGQILRAFFAAPDGKPPRSESDHPPTIRLALHTGDAHLRNGAYHGEAPEYARQLLRAAHEGQALCSEATAALARGLLQPELRLLDLGLYHLGAGAGSQSSARLFQLDDDGLPRREFPRPRAESSVAASLPLRFTRFFGREGEVQRLRDLLSPADTLEPSEPSDRKLPAASRLVTLTGPSGCGKSRLALETAAGLQNRFGGSIWFVPLAECTDARLIPGAVLGAMRLGRTAEVEPLEQLIDALQAGPTLLLLDNFEHLVSEGTAVIQSMLTQAPALRILVTSTRRLDLSDEQELVVPPLPVPAESASDVPKALSCCPSVQLFVDRAQAVIPDFQLTPGNSVALSTLCRRLEGLPLALELAAARAQLMTPAQMLTGLERRLDLLSTRRRDVPPRHRTLRAALDWTYQLLSPELRRFFAWLSVFRGGWTLEAAAIVCAQGAGSTRPARGTDLAALEYLEELRECSLVRTELMGEQLRFKVLETLREYALDQISPEELAKLQRRHAEHFLEFAQEHIRKLRTADEPTALGQLEADLENARAAFTWAQQAGETELTAELALTLGRFRRLRGYQREATERIAVGLEAVRRLGPAKAGLQADLLLERANLHLDQFEWAQARQCAEEAGEWFRGAGDVAGEAYANSILGLAARGERNYREARRLLAAALTGFQTSGSGIGTAMTWNNLGLIESDDSEGNPDAACKYWERALEQFHRLDYPRGIAEVLTNLGALAQEQGRWEDARRHYRAALDLEQGLRHVFGIARALSNLGEVSSGSGEMEQASRLFTAAGCLFEITGSPYRHYATRLLQEAGRGVLPTDLPPCEDLLRRDPEDLVAWALPE